MTIERRVPLWEFENLFVLSGDTAGAWNDVSKKFTRLKQGGLDIVRQTAAVEQVLVYRDLAKAESGEGQRQTGALRSAAAIAARDILEEARSFLTFCTAWMGQESLAIA